MSRDKERQRIASRKYHLSHIQKRLADARAWRAAHPLEVRAYNEQYHKGCKLAVYEAYGGPICVCCGESHLEFLSIDHIDGKGSEHRRAMGRSVGARQIYTWLRKHGYPPGFRVLCMNCNHALGHFDYCPHGKIQNIKSAHPSVNPDNQLRFDTLLQ